MKKLGKIIGVLVFTMLFCLSIDIVQAAAPPRLDEANLGILDTEQATLTITNVHEKDDFIVFKILDVYKNDITNEINYRYTDKFYAFLEAGGNTSKDYSYLTEEEYFKLTSGDITSGSTQTSSTLDILVSDYTAYVVKNDTKFDGKMIVNGNTASLTTDTGSYLIVSLSLDRVYAVMVGNLDYKEENGKWVKQNETIVAKASDTSIKTSIGKIGQKEASFSIGEEYTYFIEITAPVYPTNAENKQIGVLWGLSKGITFSEVDTLTIMDGERQLKVGKILNEDDTKTTYSLEDMNGKESGG